MVWPKISIIWLNYNSSRILPIVLKSLDSIANLDYPSDKFELITVDNGSTDGSFKTIKEFLKKKSSLRKKIIRLNNNYGFSGGNNIGFMARDKESKYVLLLNNDAMLFQRSLKSLVEYAESYNVAGVQGVILKWGAKFIDSAGGYINELLQTYALGGYHEYPWILRKPMYVTYVDGSCALYRVESVLKCLGDKLFIDEFFGYYEDVALSLMMWNRGYRSVAIPEIVANHFRSLSFGRGKKSVLSTYLYERNRFALSLITNTRYKYSIFSHVLKGAMLSALRTEKGLTQVRMRALYDGIKLGRKLRNRRNFIDIYKAPLVKIPRKGIATSLILERLSTRYFESWVIKNLSFLTIM